MGARAAFADAIRRRDDAAMTVSYARAEFLLGVTRLSDLPPDEGAEVAFAGRSNSGKSSVINALTRRSGLARISKTPGRTQQLNFFTLDENRRLVDLPGYGYAKVPAATKRRWAGLIEGYLRTRRSLRGVVVIMDARRPFTDPDIQLLEWCAASHLAVHVLLNKSDKLRRGSAQRALAEARRKAAELDATAGVQLFSALRASGLEELEARLDDWLGERG